MSWNKLGRIFDPESKERHHKLATHAANPLPVHMGGDIYRVFYSARDSLNRSSVGAFDINLVTLEVMCEHFDPFFTHGEQGSYYEHGVSVGGCYSVDGIVYMLFMGWQNTDGKHWRGDIGRLLLDNKLELSIKDESPLIGISSVDPISLSYPFVIKEKWGYKMWYGSTLEWESQDTEMIHVINSATSLDGESWSLEGLAVPYHKNLCQAFSRPTVIRNGDGSLDMWFSYRGAKGEKYKIGHAYSPDSISWELELSPLGLETSAHGWDSDMVEYPYAVEHKGKRFLFYSGNDYGKTGIGLAVSNPLSGGLDIDK